MSAAGLGCHSNLDKVGLHPGIVWMARQDLAEERAGFGGMGNAPKKLCAQPPVIGGGILRGQAGKCRGEQRRGPIGLAGGDQSFAGFQQYAWRLAVQGQQGLVVACGLAGTAGGKCGTGHGEQGGRVLWLGGGSCGIGLEREEWPLHGFGGAAGCREYQRVVGLCEGALQQGKAAPRRAYPVKRRDVALDQTWLSGQQVCPCLHDPWRLFGIDLFPWTVRGLADYGLAAASCMSASQVTGER